MEGDITEFKGKLEEFDAAAMKLIKAFQNLQEPSFVREYSVYFKQEVTVQVRVVKTK